MHRDQHLLRRDGRSDAVILYAELAAGSRVWHGLHQDVSTSYSATVSCSWSHWHHQVRVQARSVLLPCRPSSMPTACTHTCTQGSSTRGMAKAAAGSATGSKTPKARKGPDEAQKASGAGTSQQAQQQPSPAADTALEYNSCRCVHLMDEWMCMRVHVRVECRTLTLHG